MNQCQNVCIQYNTATAISIPSKVAVGLFGLENQPNIFAPPHKTWIVNYAFHKEKGNALVL